MAKKKYKFDVTIGVPDPSKDRPEVRDGAGNIILMASKGVRYIPAGETVELDDKEGEAILARHGAYSGPSPVTVSGITVTGESSAIIT